MPGFWDKLKGFLGIDDPKPSSPDPKPSTPAASTPPAATAPRSASSTSRPSTAAAPVTVAEPAAAPTEPAPRLFADLNAAELRHEALKIVPWNTPWIGRVDVIPPASDPRTALIDQGLILRGAFTAKQIAEFHRIGDEYLKYNVGWQQQHRARLLAQSTAAEAVEKVRAERAEARQRIRDAARARADERRALIEARKQSSIMFLGRGVSTRLSEHDTDLAKLEAACLPLLATPADVAAAMDLSISQLRWLAFTPDAAASTHYAIWEIPKRSGGKRLISAPMPRLKNAQRWVLEHLLNRLPVDACAHGFVPGHSTVTNAAPHLGADIVINLDLKDFFPTITFRRVRGLFQQLGYSGAVATILALICTEPPRQKVTWSEETWWVAIGEPALPQGAPTSPAISNQIARRLDRRLFGMCRQLGWTYTRYADDLTFSAPEGKRGEVGRLMSRVRHVVREEGFALNPDKGRVQRAERRQDVTGIVVNDKLSIPRHEVRRLRAILHQARKHGLEAQNREGHPHFEAWLRGKLAYLAMVDRDKGMAMLKQLDELVGRA